jgi:hypothetical protein
MQSLVKTTLYVFLCITTITALLALAGFAYIWFINPGSELPYLSWLASSVIAEIVSIILVFAHKGLKYLPKVEINQSTDQTREFMKQFVSTGSSATIVSNRVSWLTGQADLIHLLKEKINGGLRIEIITPQPVSREIQTALAGANFIVTNDNLPPEARFTLINGDRSGAELLAIARGAHPNHEITIFDNNSAPQIIAMAKDVIRKSKAVAHV